MDNLAHSLVGLAAAQAGCKRLSPGATALCLLAASAPDADVAILLFADRWSFLQYHRHITHSILGTLGIALLLPLLFWLGDRLIAKLRARAPLVKLRGLILASLIVSATHPFLDWTNNYGVRLLLPWDSRWFYGDFVFIVDPFIWMLLGGAVFLLTSNHKVKIGIWLLLGAVLTYLVMTTSAERGLTYATALKVVWVVFVTALVILRRLEYPKRWGRKVAWVACGLLVMYWVGLASMHKLALNEIRTAGAGVASEKGETLTDAAAMPTLANPFNWTGVVETDRAAYRFDMSLADDNVNPANLVRYERADSSFSPVVRRAAEQRPSQIFLGFARFPVFKVVGADCLSETVVQLADLRYTQPGSSRGTFALEVPITCPSEPAMGN